ncbi:MAG: extracellular solute-binding protein [Acidobacteriota bacterium]|nr:extracellular solute-binding protein [Blastocatellia bacterium]MDW8237976.1 extracellular solute-binding protein [Acidobacteriota bacterium]
MKALSRLIAVTLVLVAVCLGTSIAHVADEPLLLIRMPDEPPALTAPTEVDIRQFTSRHRALLHNTPDELLRDPSLARQVLGQQQIFEELAIFQAQHGVPVAVKFITWVDAFRYFTDYVSDASNPPVVAQLGDTWAAYFRWLGVMPYEQRHTWDVRVLWYWKDMVQADAISDEQGFIAACERLRASSPTLIAPLAIPTGLDWNLLHDLSVWLYNAGLPSLISVDKKFGLLPWREARFGGPQGERAAQFLIRLARHGYVALPEQLSTDVVEDFLARRYAMVILGPWATERAAQRLGPDWQQRIGLTLPPRIGAERATTVKGGSLLVVLDPSGGRYPAELERARRLVEFFVGPESQRRYTRALGALPGNPQALAQSPLAALFHSALEQAKTYPAMPEWAPIVENLATRDNLYAFWKRLSALTTVHSSANPTEQAAREKLILAALHSAEADINKELSPGRLAELWPWLAAVVLLAVVIAAGAVWHRRVERDRVAQLRQARDTLATLQRRMTSSSEVIAQDATPLSDSSTVATKGYPALYLDTVKRKVLLRKQASEPLEELIHGAEYELFRHILECLQVGWHETHWVWSYVIWPTAQPKYPKEAFATHCTKLRKKIENVWALGSMLGRGSHRGGAIPIQVRDVHFYTTAQPENGAHPVWTLFETVERAFVAFKSQRWDELCNLLEHLLQIDQDNWSAHMLIGHLIVHGHLDIEHRLARQALEFIQKQRDCYEHAVERINQLSPDKLNPEQADRLRARRDSLQRLIDQLPPMLMLTSPPVARKPWRTRQQLAAWASYLSGDASALPEEETKVLKSIKRFVQQRLHWSPLQETDERFRELIQDMALDTSRWPDERLPVSEKAFKYQALDHVLAGVLHLSDDAQSRSATKAQNLRKLWSARASLRQQLSDEPTLEQLAEACRQRYGWTRAAVDQLLSLEQSARPQRWIESWWLDEDADDENHADADSERSRLF